MLSVNTKGDIRKSRGMNVYIPDDIIDALRECAEKNCTSVSAVVREALSDWIGRRNHEMLAD